jgi:uncharacterized alkaline shock family protein YloU
MNTPVEHRATPSGAAADSGDLPADRPGSVLAQPERSASPAVPDQPARQTVPAELRGRTDISERVVSRIAACAAREVARVEKVGERGPLSFRGGTRAAVDGTLATLMLDVTVEYPAPIREVADEVRRHVAGRVMTLTGMDVGHIDIDVTNVTRPPSTPRESTWTGNGNQPDFRTPDTATPGNDLQSREEPR